MMSPERTAETIAAAERVRQILEEPVIVRFFEETRERLISTVIATNDPAERERVALECRLLDALRAQLEQTLALGLSLARRL